MSLSALTTLAALLVTANVPASSLPQVEVLEPGLYHGDELSLPTQSRWLALCGERLERVTVEARRVHDPLLDADDQQTGWEVGAPCEARVLLAENVGLLEGRVREADVREHHEDAGVGAMEEEAPFDEARTPAHATRPTRWGPSRVELRLGGAISEIVREPLGNGGFRLVLRARGGGSDVTLFETPEADDGHWSLLWSGDLDGDGQLDLVLQASDHYNVREVRVHLSRGGHALAGMLRSTGC